jgi:hypothetical protein
MGDNMRIVRGEEASRIKTGIETDKRATSTTEVILTVCIELYRGHVPPNASYAHIRKSDLVGRVSMCRLGLLWPQGPNRPSPALFLL